MFSITQDQHTLNQIEELYKKYFQNIDDFLGYAKSKGKLSMFIFATHNKNRYEYLIDFVQEYFKMKNNIECHRNNLIETFKSPRSKKVNWFNMIHIRLKITNMNRYCKLFNKFEDEFYKKLGVSLLVVENERCVREQKANKEQIV